MKLRYGKGAVGLAVVTLFLSGCALQAPIYQASIDNVSGLKRNTARSARVGTQASTVFRAGPIEVDFEKRLVTVNGVETHLTPIEFKLLQTVVRHAGRVVTQRQLLNEVWGPNHVEQSQYLRVYMGQLRRKLEADPARPQYLRTEPGVGYRFVAE